MVNKLVLLSSNSKVYGNAKQTNKTQSIKENKSRGDTFLIKKNNANMLELKPQKNKQNYREKESSL